MGANCIYFFYLLKMKSHSACQDKIGHILLTYPKSKLITYTLYYQL